MLEANGIEFGFRINKFRGELRLPKRPFVIGVRNRRAESEVLTDQSRVGIPFCDE